MTQSATTLGAAALLLQAAFVLAGRLQILVSKAVGKGQLELSAFRPAGYIHILAGKMAGGTPFQRLEQVAYRGLECSITVQDLLLQATVNAPEKGGFQRALPNGRRAVKAADFRRPSLAEAIAVLRINIYGPHV